MAKGSKTKSSRPMRMTDSEKKDIMERVAKGESPPGIAKSIGRNYVTVLKFIKSQRASAAPTRASRNLKQGATSKDRLKRAKEQFDAALEDLLAAQAEVATDDIRAKLSRLV